MKGLWNREPVMVSQVAGAIVALAAVFGCNLSLDQAAALVTVVQLVAGLIGRSQVSPTA